MWVIIKESFVNNVIFIFRDGYKGENEINVYHY